MARNTTLENLLIQYRAECRMSLNAAQNAGARSTQVKHIQRTQDWLWEDFDWPLLRVERRIELQAGQRYYAMPGDLHIDRIQKVEIFTELAYVELCAGIDAEQYSAYNSDLGERSSPAQRWRISEDEQFEVWPIPETDFNAVSLDNHVKITGIRKLQTLVEDSHRADLDDRLIILFCAAEYLAGTGAKDANVKMDMANKHYAKLRGSQMPRKVFKMFGVGEPERRPRRYPIAVYNES